MGITNRYVTAILLSLSLISTPTLAYDEYGFSTDDSYYNDYSTRSVPYYDDDSDDGEDYYYERRQPVQRKAVQAPRAQYYSSRDDDDDDRSYSSAAMPGRIKAPGEKLILVNPKIHAWGAYNASGILLRSGIATSGSKWCSDLGRPCKTTSGSFRIKSLGDEDCVSSKYPLGEGGAPMPYCMYFNGSQGLHGSNGVARANLSHGCVRLRVSDAQWVRYNFANIGTRVVIQPY